jgi:hypothetical protein
MAEGYLRVYQQIIRQASAQPTLTTVGATALLPMQGEAETAVA